MKEDSKNNNGNCECSEACEYGIKCYNAQSRTTCLNDCPVNEICQNRYIAKSFDFFNLKDLGKPKGYGLFANQDILKFVFFSIIAI
jgi:hypothetical protein